MWHNTTQTIKLLIQPSSHAKKKFILTSFQQLNFRFSKSVLQNKKLKWHNTIQIEREKLKHRENFGQLKYFRSKDWSQTLQFQIFIKKN